MSTQFIDDSYAARFLVVTDAAGRTLYREDTREYSNGWDADSIQRFRASSSRSECLQEVSDDGAAAIGTRWYAASQGAA